MLTKNGSKFFCRRTAGNTSGHAISCCDSQFASAFVDSQLAHVVQLNESRRPRPAGRVPPDYAVTDAKSPNLILDEPVDVTEALEQKERRKQARTKPALSRGFNHCQSRQRGQNETDPELPGWDAPHHGTPAASRRLTENNLPFCRSQIIRLSATRSPGSVILR